jgi:protein O-mannosyl-transferase
MSNRNKPSNKRTHQVRPAILVHSARLKLILAGAAIIVCVVFLAYLPSLNGGFLLDDDTLLTENNMVQTPGGLYQFWFTNKSIDYWPVTNTTFWFEWRLWEMNSAGFHVSNLILHVVDTLLIWIILRKLSIPGAFWAAMLFALHPVNVESVAWIASRKNLLSMLFFLLSILWFLKFLERAPRPTFGWRPLAAKQILPTDCHPLSTDHHPLSTDHCPPPVFSSFILHPSSFILWYGLSLSAFILAMLSKGSAVLLPAVLLGIIWWRRRVTINDLVRIAPFIIVAVTLAVVNIWFQTHGSGIPIRPADFTERLLGAGGVVWFYLYQAVLPINLALVYPQWTIKPANLLWWLPLFACLIITLVLWGYRKSWSRQTLLAWGFFCLALVPVMGFTDVGYMRYSMVADRYQHFAMIGVLSLSAAGYGAWLKRTRGTVYRVSIFTAALVVGILFCLTWRQSALYNDTATYYQAMLQKNPHCWGAYNNLGKLQYKAGNPKKAIEYYKQALAVDPNDARTHFNLAEALRSLDQSKQAIIHYQKALSIYPRFVYAHNDLGTLLATTDQHQKAIEEFQIVIRLNPDFAEAYGNLAVAYSKINRPTEALAFARKAMEVARSTGKTKFGKEIEAWLQSYMAELSTSPSMPPDEKPAPPTH